MTHAQPTQRESAPRRYEKVVRRLEEQMLAGKYVPGDKLPSERALMAQFAVGRGSVREALFALQKMGLVALAAGERAYVTRPTAENLLRELSGAARQLLAAPGGVRHFQQARRLFECGMVREAAAKATPEGTRRLFEALEANRTATSVARAVASDIEFHYRIAEMSANPVLTALHTALGEWLREQRTTSVQATNARRNAHRAHRKIYDAIAARDPERAAEAMRAHLEEVEAFYWQVAEALPT
jgi:GntR family transcriptional regulator, sialic acid-inducible nan operon repressor